MGSMSGAREARNEGLRCRWCAFTVQRFYTGKDGKPRSGWGRLNSHIEKRHPDEWEAMQATLGDPADASEERLNP